jgi:hypothetical protein
MNREAASKKIYTTFFGIGIDFNSSLVDIISKTKGCSYHTISDELEF